VGAAIAAGSQAANGICALFLNPLSKRKTHTKRKKYSIEFDISIKFNEPKLSKILIHKNILISPNRFIRIVIIPE
jgi:hypothetical protein